ncbi:hypothetical protein GCM10028804_56890 [Larkinella terrae]
MWLACQSKDSSEFGIEPGGNTYNDEASPAKKMMCSGTNCDSPVSVEQYTYNKNGKLVRTDYLGRVASGQLELFSYVEQIFNKHDNLVGKIRYGKYGNDNTWTAYEESEYEYADGALKTERIYFNQRNPEQRVLTGLVQYEFKDGKKIGQKWFDAREQLSYRVTYEYKNDVLTRETWYSNTDKVTRVFTHSFAGNRRQVSEHLPSSTEQIALIEKVYDKKGRLFSEETKVNNPFLCSMVAGIVQYAY